MQAQTVQQRSGAPWLALVLALLFAVAVVIGVQLAFRGEEVGTTTGPAVQTQVDQADIQRFWLSKAGIHRIDGTATAPGWTSHGSIRPPTPEGTDEVPVKDGGTPPDFLPAMARGLQIRGGRI